MATNPLYPTPTRLLDPAPLPPDVQELLLEALELAKRVDQRLREKSPPGGHNTVTDTPPVARTIGTVPYLRL